MSLDCGKRMYENKLAGTVHEHTLQTALTSSPVANNAVVSAVLSKNPWEVMG